MNCEGFAALCCTVRADRVKTTSMLLSVQGEMLMSGSDFMPRWGTTPDVKKGSRSAFCGNAPKARPGRVEGMASAWRLHGTSFSYVTTGGRAAVSPAGLSRSGDRLGACELIALWDWLRGLYAGSH